MCLGIKVSTAGSIMELVMQKISISALVIALWVCSGFAAENVYYNWTDKDGIKRYSDQPPSQNIKQYKTIQTTPGSSEHETAVDSRPEYNSMVEKAKEETRQLEQERIKKEALKAAEEKRNAESDMKARIETERQRLNEKIDAINKRPLSRTYDQSFKQARIDEIKKELDKLSNSPDEYFKSR